MTQKEAIAKAMNCMADSAREYVKLNFEKAMIMTTRAQVYATLAVALKSEAGIKPGPQHS